MDDPVGTDDAHPGRTMARLARPRAAESTRLALVADPHVATRSAGTSKLYELTERHLRAALADAGRGDVDAVVSVGDLTKDGEPWNYDAVDDLVATLDVPFLAVPGNHDVPKTGDDHDTPPVARFEDRYTPGGLPFAERVGGVDVVGINTAGTGSFQTGTHEGATPAATVRWLSDTLPGLDAPVVVAHHNLPAMHDQLRAHRDAVAPEMGLPPGVRDAAPYVEALADADAPLVLTGHLHMPGTAVERGVREVMAPTTCSFPQAYLLVDVGPRGTAIRFVPVADGAGLREGYHRLDDRGRADRDGVGPAGVVPAGRRVARGRDRRVSRPRHSPRRKSTTASQTRPGCSWWSQWVASQNMRSRPSAQ